MKYILKTTMLIFLIVKTVSAADVAFIISGLAGDKKFYNKFWKQSSALYYNLIDYGFNENNIIFLFEDKGYRKEIVDYDSRFKNIKLVMTDLNRKLKEGDVLYIFIIGHASKDYEQDLKLHLRGPDLTPLKLQEMVDVIPAKKICFFIFTPYSGKFIPYLSRRNRIIITSCDKHEKSQPFFLEEFNKTLVEMRKLAESTKKISLYQVILQTELMVSERYSAEGFVKTEHSLVDSDGDGIGHNELSKEDIVMLKLIHFTPSGEDKNKQSYKTVVEENIKKPDKSAQEEVNDTVWRYVRNSPGYERYKTEAVYLLKHVEKDVNEDGLSQYKYHNIIKIYTEGGRKYSEIRIPSGYGEAPRIILARTFKPDSTVVPVDFHSLLTGRQESMSAIEKDMLYMKFSMPAVEDGCVIEYEYSVKKSAGYSSVSFTSFENLQMKIPVLKSEYMLTVPKQSKVGIIPRNLEIKITKTSEKYSNRYYMTAEDIPMRPVEIYSPHPFDLMKGFIVSTKSSWEEIDNWFYHLAQPQLDTDTGIREKVDELIKDARDTETKIEKIYNYVSKNIRYVAIELGIQGYKPHYAPMIFRNKYGDCKDKATLFITMLKYAGIKAYHVLINAGGPKIDFRYPFLGAFNHCITAVPGKNNNFKFLDVTPPACPYNSLPYYDQGRYSLVVLDKKGKFVKIPFAGPEDNLRKIDLELVNIEKDKADIKGSIYFTGVNAAGVRNRLIESGEKERKMFIKMMAARYEPNSVLIDYKIKNLENISEPLEAEFTYRILYLEHKAGNISIININLPQFEFSALQSLEKRQTDIVFPFTISEIIEFKMKIPEGKNFKNKVNTKKMVQGIDTEMSMDLKDGYIVKTIKVDVNKIRIDKEHFKEVKKLLNEIYVFKKEPVIFMDK